jgi:hypothetical protein
MDRMKIGFSRRRTSGEQERIDFHSDPIHAGNILIHK